MYLTNETEEWFELECLPSKFHLLAGKFPRIVDSESAGKFRVRVMKKFLTSQELNQLLGFERKKL